MSHVIYFAGAGLTKALQGQDPALRIPLMADFVSVMADRTDDDVILTTLVSLELGGLFEWYDPKAHELAEPLAHRERRTDELRGAFAEALQRRPSENIETLLLRVERQSKPNVRGRARVAAAKLLGNVRRLIGSGAPRHARTALEDAHREFTPVRFNYAISRLFSLIRWNLEWPPLAAFLADQIDQPNSEHTLVSFNYDLVLERCLQETRPDAWSVRDGYGFEIHHSVRSDLVPAHSRQFEGPGGAFAPLPADEVAAIGQRRRCTILLGGHLKTGHAWTGQNRPPQGGSETGC